MEEWQRLTVNRQLAGVLSVIYSIFDHVGFIAPYTMNAKLLLQTLSRMKLRWDDRLGENERLQWMRWLQDLPKLPQVQVDRCFKPETFRKVRTVTSVFRCLTSGIFRGSVPSFGRRRRSSPLCIRNGD